MSDTIQIPAQMRELCGKGASRRLRRQGLVPGVLYGGDVAPIALQIPHNFLIHALDDEVFYTSIMELAAEDGRRQKVILRDLQRHPFKHEVMHIDFQRISDKEELRMIVPLHFVNEDQSPAGKQSGVVISHLIAELEITCLPKDLPEYLELDLGDIDVGSQIRLSEIPLPKGVTLTAHGDDLEAPVVSVQHVGTGESSSEEGDEEAEEPAAE